jgi:hypothetical protein
LVVHHGLWAQIAWAHSLMFVLAYLVPAVARHAVSRRRPAGGADRAVFAARVLVLFLLLHFWPN